MSKVCLILLLLIIFVLITRDASYTTQPLELLNALGFENLKNNGGLIRDLEVDLGDSTSVDNHQYDSSDNGAPRTPNATVLMDHNQESGPQMNSDASEG